MWSFTLRERRLASKIIQSVQRNPENLTNNIGNAAGAAAQEPESIGKFLGDNDITENIESADRDGFTATKAGTNVDFDSDVDAFEDFNRNHG